MLLSACSAGDTGELRIVADSTTRPRTVEVLAVPFDPAPILRAAGAPVGRTAAPGRRSARQEREDARRDSVAALRRALDDSARALDARFQRERLAVNDLVRALAARDRHTRAYAAAVDAIERRRAAARALRARRDHLRAQLSALPAADTASGWTERWRAALSHAARAAGTAVVHRRVAAPDTTRIALRPGRWWIVVDRGNEVDVLSPARDVRAGSSEVVPLQ